MKSSLNSFLALPARFHFFFRRLRRRLLMWIYRPLFAAHGMNFRFDPDGLYSYEHVFVGHDVSLGGKPVLMAAKSEIHIGDHVMFGPEVMVIGGGHNLTQTGRFMTQVNEKTGNEDLGVVIEDDVWVGARSMILRGVRVGRGAVIGAGSIVTKSVPPYAIVAGCPAGVVRFRWTVDQILQHEAVLYPEAKRFTKAELTGWQEAAVMLPPKRADQGSFPQYAKKKGLSEG